MQPNIQEITKEVEAHSHFTDKITAEVKKIIVGQDYLIERLLIGLLANGHIHHHLLPLTGCAFSYGQLVLIHMRIS